MHGWAILFSYQRPELGRLLIMRYNLLVKKYEKNIRLHRGNAIEPNEVDKIDELTPKHTEIHVE